MRVKRSGIETGPGRGRRSAYTKKMALRVMIVDDAGFIRQILGKILEATGCDIVAEARSGMEAVEKAIQFRPEVIFMDIILPGKNGADAAAEILESLPGTPIIAMSTAAEAPVRVKAMEAGCVSFLEKPFNRESVNRVLQDIRSGGMRVQYG